MIKSVKYLLQSLIIYIFFLIARIVGLKISRFIFSYIFLLIGPRIKSRKIVEKNLNFFSYKEKNINKKKIITEMWKNYGMTFVEYIFLKKFRKKSNHVSIKGIENLNEVTQNKKPVIFISGHFANFELMSMEITKKNIQLATIYRPLNNFFLNPFMEYLRKKYICKNQIKKGIKGVRDAIQYIKNKHSIALMIDQRVSEGMKVNFFNKSALTTTLPAQLSIKFEIDIIPVYIERTRNNTFVLEFQDRLNPKNYSDKKVLTEKLNDVLEKMVIKNPYQWIWTHNRWK